MKTLVKKVIEENEPSSSFIRRVGDIKALELVKAGDWLYTSKLVRHQSDTRTGNFRKRIIQRHSRHFYIMPFFYNYIFQCFLFRFIEFVYKILASFESNWQLDSSKFRITSMGQQ